MDFDNKLPVVDITEGRSEPDELVTSVDLKHQVSRPHTPVYFLAEVFVLVLMVGWVPVALIHVSSLTTRRGDRYTGWR